MNLFLIFRVDPEAAPEAAPAVSMIRKITQACVVAGVLAGEALAAGGASAEHVLFDGSFKDVGIYGITGNAGIAHRKIIRQHMQGPGGGVPQVEPGRKIIMQLPLLDPNSEEDRALLALWLSSVDAGAIWLLHFGEENKASDHARLQALTDLVRGQSKIPVFAWFSQPLGPMGAMGAHDGFWYDAYGPFYAPFRELVRLYLETGLPLGLTIDASRYSDLASAREQVMVCKEFDLPVTYFACQDGSGSFGGWMAAGSFMAPARNFMFSAIGFHQRSAGHEPLGAGDFLWGDLIEVWPQFDGNFAVDLPGTKRATVFGLTRLDLREGKVVLKGDGEAALEYHVLSGHPARGVELSIESVGDADGLLVEVSRRGMPGTWVGVLAFGEGPKVFPLGDPGREFRLRVSLTKQGSGFHGARLTGTTSPEGGAVELHPDFLNGWQGRIEYSQDLAAGSWQTVGTLQGQEHLKDGNLFALRGRQGSAVSATSIQSFHSAKPLYTIEAIAHGSENTKSLGGSFNVGVLLPGDAEVRWSNKALQPPHRGTWLRGTKSIRVDDLPEDGIHNFEVHLRLANNSGVTTTVASSITKLEILANLNP